MNLVDLLQRSKASIVADALQRLTRARLPHYAASAATQNEQRLATLYDLVHHCVSSRRLAPIVEHAGAVARERFEAGFGLDEVHTAFNVLEEVIWQTVTAQMPPSRYAEALGLTSTVLGAGKQALAVEYVALASHGREMRTLDVTALFQGTA
jgi:hypothetical protein